MRVLLIIFLLSIFLTTSYFFIKNISIEYKVLDDPKKECGKMDGIWESFPNSCVDSCDLINKDIYLCAQVITEGCDCGVYRCWNGETCEAHTSYPTQEQCESEDKCTCIDINCDYIPKGKTLEEVCEVGFEAGWTCDYD